MKAPLQILGWLIFVSILLVVGAAVVYPTAKGHMKWYFRVNGQVTVDGHETGGYMHANTDRTILLVTRTDGIRPETYLVSLGNEKAVLDCGEWHPIRLLAFPVTDVNPPCSAVTVDSSRIVDAPVAATLVRRSRSVEFSTASGKNVKAEW